jgi:N-acylneuraminate cytidylyltransferase
VPGKNLRLLAGKPLIAWSIEQALAANCISKVVVSTDAPEIAEVARRYGADVPFLRPAELATDTAATEPVMAHAIDHLEQSGQHFDQVMLLQPTSPLRLPGTLDGAHHLFTSEQADSLLGVVENHHFFWRRTEQVEALYDYRARPRRQDLTESTRWYRETGSIYITKIDAFKASRNRLSGRISLFQMNEIEGWEIDTEIDFAVLDALFTKVPHAHR